MLKANTPKLVFLDYDCVVHSTIHGFVAVARHLAESEYEGIVVIHSVTRQAHGS